MILRHVQFHLDQKPLKAIFLFFVLLVACSDDDHKTLQIVNDDLEGANSWQFVNVSPAAHSGGINITEFASASHSLGIKSSVAVGSGFSYWSYWWTPKNIPVGSKLELTVKVKVEGVTGPGTYVALRGDIGTGSGFFESTQGKQTISGSQEFATYKVTLESFPEGITAMAIFFVLDGTSTGAAFFDDISLVSHH